VAKNKMDFQKAVELIGKSNKVLITTHTRPDGDGCGCIAAISETLTTLGKNPKILLLSEAPAQYEFLFATNSIKSVKSVAKLDPDLIIIVDTSSFSQLPELVPLLSSLVPPPSSLVIDHHATSDNIGDVRLIDDSAAATALIVFDLLKYAGWPITKKIAEALFVAVSTDTGWFQFDNTDSRTLKVCAELIDAAVIPSPLIPRPPSLVSRMYRQLYQNTSPQQFRLMTAMLNTLELHLDGRYAVFCLLPSDFKTTGANYSDTENLIDQCRRISGVEAAALFVEQTNGHVKVSLRSWSRLSPLVPRPSVPINVSKIAKKFEGGGHKMAAGAILLGPIENAKKLILNAVAEQFKQSI
jgi:phosphoesterase RecJ-like protein